MSALRTGNESIARESYQALTPSRNEPKALWSMILGIVSIIFLPILAGIPAIVLGHMSRANIRESRGTMGGGGLAMAGLVMGYGGITVYGAIMVLFFTVVVAFISTFLGLRQAVATASGDSGKTDPVADVRTINSALAQYKQKFNTYPPDLGSLGPNYGHKEPAQAANLVPFSLAVGMKGDYLYTYEKTSPDKNDGGEGYTVHANPLDLDFKNPRHLKHYYSDQTGMIRYSDENEAGPNSDVMKADQPVASASTSLLLDRSWLMSPAGA
ncbi:MAG TPA: DUF4190 domain-containing protein [Candidatus Angelobacter sp.]|nr:DUF4190 domain-containing protein [Candidatus Angelobacter sp.]